MGIKGVKLFAIQGNLQILDFATIPPQYNPNAFLGMKGVLQFKHLFHIILLRNLPLLYLKRLYYFIY